ncbi:11072_t:CDS:2 [Funneliformis mosseae]|uniref:11072_t:CDS:1 n=1 Tax=Funneliformis mosseae TaxID=27381 RepID=A0A9N8VBL2_FUNMO|nr:11072_t:CDS:2 [Funneliformis mosseae]
MCKIRNKFMSQSIPRLQERLTYDRNWKEGDNKLNECNPAFGPEFVEMMNEGTYVNNVIISAIHTTLFDNSFREHAFITIIASSDRRSDGCTGRWPYIMLVSKERDKLYEFIYVECSQNFCNKQKKDDDNVKL